MGLFNFLFRKQEEAVEISIAGIKLVRQNKFQEGIDLLEKVIILKPKEPRAYAQLGDSYLIKLNYELNKISGSVIDFMQYGYGSEPVNIDNKTICMLEEIENKAESYYLKAIEMHPQKDILPIIYKQLGGLYYISGHINKNSDGKKANEYFKKAAAVYGKVINISPSDALSTYFCGLCYFCLYDSIGVVNATRRLREINRQDLADKLIFLKTANP